MIKYSDLNGDRLKAVSSEPIGNTQLDCFDVVAWDPRGERLVRCIARHPEDGALVFCEILYEEWDEDDNRWYYYGDTNEAAVVELSSCVEVQEVTGE